MKLSTSVVEASPTGTPRAEHLERLKRKAPLATQEAVLSSRIEGTQATFGEVLEFEASGETAKVDSNKVADIQEVLNYRSAMHHGVELMRKLPLSQRVVREHLSR